MDPFVVGLAGGVLLAGIAVLSVLVDLQQSRKYLRLVQEALASCGLQWVVTSRWSGPQLKARAGPVEVLLERAGQITILVPGPPDFCSVRIRPEEPRLQERQEIEIGDELFDSTFNIEGPMPLVCALLDAEARRLLICVNAESWLEIFKGRFQAFMSEEKVPHLLPLLLDIGQRFAQPMDIPQRLAENASRDPEAGVRLQNLLLLLRERPGDPATVEVLRAACSDPSPEIRLRAAKELGSEGRDVLLELAESPVDDAVSAEVVSTLDRELPVERTIAILDHALSKRRIQTARACLAALGRSGATEAVDTLAKVMAHEQSELAAAAAQVLGTTGSPAAEPPLILALQREPAALRLAAAKALGRVGSAAAVLPLEEAAERFWFERELYLVMFQAIAEIQSRVPGASPGQLSLAGAEVGQLSLAQAEAGQLSLATDAAGQLSFSDDEEGRKPPPGGVA